MAGFASLAIRSHVAASMLLMANAFQTSSEAFTTSAEGNDVFMVPLDEQNVPVFHEGRQVAVKTAYHGKIFVGGPRPQNFTVVFDTGSAHLILPSAECTDESCKLHQRYDYAASETSIKIDFDGKPAEAGLKPEERDQVNVGYGTGEITGDLASDNVCIGFSVAEARAAKRAPVNTAWDAEKKMPANCARVRVISALQMTEEPFSHFDFDGILGLGLPALALDPEYHFFGQLAKRMQIAPLFSFYLSRSSNVQSEITFGGRDLKRMVGGADAVNFVPVERPQDGYWRVQIRSVRVGNTPVPYCDNGACTAIVDTGTSILAVPSEPSNELLDLTTRKLSDHITSLGDGDDATGVRTQVPESQWSDCRRVPGPPLVFDMGDFEIVLQAEDYSREEPRDIEDLEGNGSNVTHTVCLARLLPLDMEALGQRVFIWGRPVLQKYYTTYDVEGQRVGFVTAAHPTADEEPTSETKTQAAAEAFVTI